MLFGKFRILGKLALLVLIPLLGVVALSVPIVVNRINAARDAQSTADLVELATRVGSTVQELQEERLLSAYFGEPPGDRRRATLALMRYMSDFREAMWGVVQGTVSDLDFDYAGYAREHFDRLGRTGADGRFEDWLEAAAE